MLCFQNPLEQCHPAPSPTLPPATQTSDAMNNSSSLLSNPRQSHPPFLLLQLLVDLAFELGQQGLQQLLDLVAVLALRRLALGGVEVERGRAAVVQHHLQLDLGLAVRADLLHCNQTGGWGVNTGNVGRMKECCLEQGCARLIFFGLTRL